MVRFNGYNSEELQILNDTEMDELTARLLDSLGESSSPIQDVNLYEFLYEVSRNNRGSLSPESIAYYRRAYIDILMEQGWTLKKEDVRSHQDARFAFEKAVRLEKNNPLAHYRLAHIAVKYEDNRSEALSQFIKALEQNGQTKVSKYKLSTPQVANASGIAVKLFTEVIDLGSFEVPELQMKSLESSIHTLQNLVENVSDQVVIHITKNGLNCEENYISHDKYLELKDQLESDASQLVIDIADEQSSLSFCKNYAVCDSRTTRRLLSILEIDGLSTKDLVSETKRNTLSKQISRLSEKLESIGVYESMFELFIPDLAEPVYKTDLTIHYFKNIFD